MYYAQLLTANRMDQKAGIFEKFYRGRNQRMLIQGTGMGLPIAKAIIELHGGQNRGHQPTWLWISVLFLPACGMKAGVFRARLVATGQMPNRALLAPLFAGWHVAGLRFQRVRQPGNDDLLEDYGIRPYFDLSSQVAALGIDPRGFWGVAFAQQ